MHSKHVDEGRCAYGSIFALVDLLRRARLDIGGGTERALTSLNTSLTMGLYMQLSNGPVAVAYDLSGARSAFLCLCVAFSA